MLRYLFKYMVRIHGVALNHRIHLYGVVLSEVQDTFSWRGT
jgi:hypothetical protein